MNFACKKYGSQDEAEDKCLVLAGELDGDCAHCPEYQNEKGEDYNSLFRR